MNLLILGIVLFFGMHLSNTIPPLKKLITGLVGAKGYKPVFAIVSLIGLVLMIMGYADKPMLQIPEWVAPTWARHAMMLAMLIAIILQPAAHMPGNIKRFTRHPMLWGIVIWSGMHLWLNGDHASILLFGSFLVYSLWAMLSANMRGAKKQTKKLPIKKDIVVIMAGTTAYILIVMSHKWIAGVALF